MHTCEYKVWCNNELEPCGKEANPFLFPDNSYLRKYGLHGYISLCDEHKNFVVDSIDQRETSKYRSNLPNCIDCKELVIIKCNEETTYICIKGKSNLSNWPFKHTKCKYFKINQK